MRRLILGTAGHIDHGKTALVRALTGVDTDRLAEEKERGITIDLGFAELASETVRLGVVDVPGHEGFVRNMLAGATGMDVVLLVIAADEGVMPQTREHLAIVSLLGVERLVVALTKADLVEEEWMELVRDEARELLEGTPAAGAPLVATSAVTGRGLEELRAALWKAADDARESGDDDLFRLPVDRVFTVRGTGTVVTGTLWSGRVREGDELRVLPSGAPGRVRGLEVHGRAVKEAGAGERTAVALAGPGIDREHVSRGDTLVALPEWRATSMLTVRARVLGDTGWSLAHNQRVRVHAGTAEVMARTVVLDDVEAIPPGSSGWIQLRLEAPVVARGRERVVLRSFSPVTTIAGGRVAEPLAPKRKSLDDASRRRLERILDADTTGAVAACLELAGWRGVPEALLPVLTGLPPEDVASALMELGDAGALEVGEAVLGPGPTGEAERTLLEQVDDFHRSEPLRFGLPLERLRATLPGRVPAGTADAVLGRLEARGRLVRRGDVVARPSFEPELTEGQRRLRDRLAALYAESGLSAPAVEGLPPELSSRDDVWAVLKLMEASGALVALGDDGYFVDAAVLADAVDRVRRELGGRSALGPTDFKEVLPVSRKHLLRILQWMDGEEVTVRRPAGREVPETG